MGKRLVSLVADDVIYSKPTAVTITSVTVENYMENYMASDVQATIIFFNVRKEHSMQYSQRTQ